MKLFKLLLVLGPVSAALIDRGYPQQSCSKYSCLGHWAKGRKWCQLATPTTGCAVSTTTVGTVHTETSTSTSKSLVYVHSTTTVGPYATCFPPGAAAPNDKRAPAPEPELEERDPLPLRLPLQNPHQQQQCGSPPACVRSLAPAQQLSACACARYPTGSCSSVVTAAPSTTTSVVVVTEAATLTVTVQAVASDFALYLSGENEEGKYIHLSGTTVLSEEGLASADRFTFDVGSQAVRASGDNDVGGASFRVQDGYDAIYQLYFEGETEGYLPLKCQLQSVGTTCPLKCSVTTSDYDTYDTFYAEYNEGDPSVMNFGSASNEAGRFYSEHLFANGQPLV